jgi:hypothetical protein
MSLRIDYSGLYRANNRDKKYNRRRKLKMTEDGRSVKLLEKLAKERIEKAQDDLRTENS